MRSLHLYLILILIFSASCNSRSNQNDNANISVLPRSDKGDIFSDSLPVLDTTIILKDIKSSIYKGESLNDSIAKSILYSHFSKKGYYNSDNLPSLGDLTDEDDQKLEVDYSSIFLIDLNNNKYLDCIILYWLTPPYANGRCWQPHKSVIIDTDNGYKVTNEEFIADKFAIDSVVSKGVQTIIYGYDYECSNNRVLRHLRIRIK